MNWRVAILCMGFAWPALPAAAQTLHATQALSFGRFVANGGGTVSVTPASGWTRTGGVILVPSGAGAAAHFQVSGAASQAYTITLPSDNQVVLSNGSNTMAVNNFSSSPSGSGTLSPSGQQQLRVGAELTVSGSQAPGTYTGSFPVTVNYN